MDVDNMAKKNLLDLPDEVLLQICEYLLPKITLPAASGTKYKVDLRYVFSQSSKVPLLAFESQAGGKEVGLLYACQKLYSIYSTVIFQKQEFVCYAKSSMARKPRIRPQGLSLIRRLSMETKTFITIQHKARLGSFASFFADFMPALHDLDLWQRMGGVGNAWNMVGIFYKKHWLATFLRLGQRVHEQHPNFSHLHYSLITKPGSGGSSGWVNGFRFADFVCIRLLAPGITEKETRDALPRNRLREHVMEVDVSKVKSATDEQLLACRDPKQYAIQPPMKPDANLVTAT